MVLHFLPWSHMGGRCNNTTEINAKDTSDFFTTETICGVGATCEYSVVEHLNLARSEIYCFETILMSSSVMQDTSTKFSWRQSTITFFCTTIRHLLARFYPLLYFQLRDADSRFIYVLC